MLDLKQIDQSWTLFLDRDGVINEEKDLDYIYHYGEFRFYQGAIDAIKKFSSSFGHMIIITNQRGVEKRLMTEEDLVLIHQSMVSDLEKGGGRIDGIYYCTSLDNAHPNRKPQAGMAFLAQKDFPAIDFSRSIMVGNNLSDMRFGRNAGMFTIFIKTTNPDQDLPHPDIDLAFQDLASFAQSLD